VNRRQFLYGVSAGTAALAGCNGSPQQPPQRVTVPSLSVVNHDPRPATVTVVLTDAAGDLHLWETVELDAWAEGGTVDVHEFERAWVEPRNYQLLVKWREQDETYSGRVADLSKGDECAPLVVKLRDGIQFSMPLSTCPDPE